MSGRKFVIPLLIVGGVATLAGVALSQSTRPEPTRLTTEASKAGAPVRIDENPLADINLVITEDGRMTIAGVLSYTRDAEGNAIVEVAPHGDFSVDSVLELTVPLILDPSGESLQLPLKGIGLHGENRQIVIDTNESATAGTEAEVCAMYQDLDPPYGTHCRNYNCPPGLPRCAKTTTGDPPVVICDCLGPYE